MPGPYGQKNRQRCQRHQTRQPQQRVAHCKAGKKFHAARRDFRAEGRRHSLALNQEQVQRDYSNKASGKITTCAAKNRYSVLIVTSCPPRNTCNSQLPNKGTDFTMLVPTVVAK